MCVLDFRKGFDKVPHKRLLKRLEHLGGVKGKLLDWIRDFHEKSMSTVIGGKHSTWRRVASEVPQESVLAPIIFTDIVNNLTPNISSGSYPQRRIRGDVSCQCLQSEIHSHGAVL